jgi:hypothetical protein
VSEQPGSIGVEAARLLEAVQQWARGTFGEAPISTGAPECEWCPICRFVSVLRGDHPETTERVVAAGSAMLAALRAVLDVLPNGCDPGGHAHRPADNGAPESQPVSRVQRIDLGGE